MASSPNDSQVEDQLNALLVWLQTFPSFLQAQNASVENSQTLLQDARVATAIFKVAEEIIGTTTVAEAATDDEASLDNVWSAMTTLVATTKFHASSTPDADRLFVVSALLTLAVSEQCTKRKTYIERIMGLDQSIQHSLMTIIESTKKQQQQQQATLPQATAGAAQSTPGSSNTATRRNLDGKFAESSATPDCASAAGTPSSSASSSRLSPICESGTRRRRRHHQALDNDNNGLTPQQHKKQKMANLFSPGTLDADVAKMVEELQQEKEALQSDLDESQQRETQLSTQIQDLEVKLKKEMIKLESSAMQRSDTMRQEYEAEIAQLQQELAQLTQVRDQQESAQQELAKIKDDVDILEHTRQKLADTEERLLKCRERLELLGDVKEALKREQEAHAASVAECLRLTNELAALQPLKRQLEDYKERAADAQVKLAESQVELKKFKALSQNLNSEHENLVQGAKLHQAQAEELRQQLSTEAAATASDDGPTMGDSMSEMNPQVKEELLRLRSDNERLAAFAAKRQGDAVETLEERLDDASRLATKFKDQYLFHKNELESTQRLLEESREREETLRDNVNKLTSKLTESRQALTKTRQEFSEMQTLLDTTQQSLQESREREQALKRDVTEWTVKAGAFESLAELRLQNWNETKVTCDETMKALQASRQREEQLVVDVEEWLQKHQVLQEHHVQLQTDLKSTKTTLDTAQVALQQAGERETQLRKDLDDMTSDKDQLEQDLQAERKAKQEALVAAENELKTTVEILQEASKQELQELQKNLNEQLESERHASREQLLLKQDSYNALSEQSEAELKEMETKLASSLEATEKKHQESMSVAKNEFEAEMIQVKTKAANDREALIQKGKGMLKDVKAKANEEIQCLEDELDDTKECLTKTLKDKDELERASRAKIGSYKNKLQFATKRMEELNQESDELQESVQKIEREKFKLVEENDRFRRQLGGRYGADGKTQSQLEMLQKEFSAVLEENRHLKKAASGRSGGGVLGAVSESSQAEFEGSSRRGYARGGASVSGSTLSQLREEYEEQIQALNDEKRELVMRNSAAITNVQKAEQRSWELEKELGRLKEELTSTKLAVQRAERRADEHSVVMVAEEESFHTAEPSEEEHHKNLLGDFEESTDKVAKHIFSPGNRSNSAAPSNDAVGSGSKRKSIDEASATGASSSNKSKKMPSLMDLTKVGGGGEENIGNGVQQQECKQS